MGFIGSAQETFRTLSEAAQILPSMARFKIAEDEDVTSLGAVFEQTVNEHGDRTMLIFEGREWTYAQFNAEVNRLARVLQAQGVERGNSVAVLMENRAEFLLACLAIMKLGAGAALINNSLTGAALVHCLNATSAQALVVGEERVSAVDDIRSELALTPGRDYLWFPDQSLSSSASQPPDWALDAVAAMDDTDTANLPLTQQICAGETALYIFTSGTTGLPKAAIVAHRKILAAALGMGRAGFRLRPTDRLYLCLPIYHLTGLGPGLCSFLTQGGSIFLRRHFSASNFWPEVHRYNTNCFIYVGELCRYLAIQPPCPEERNNPLQKMVGNGLRPDVWDTFKSRFGVPRICEFYGSSEGNVTFINFFNKEKTIGASFSPVALVAYDMDNDTILRDAAGRCIEVPVGEPGLLLAKIGPQTKFDGYTNPEATRTKILENVKEDGDRWFNTGDLIKEIDVGFALGFKHYQFVDRTGDTFRWRAENVSTNEVAEVLNQHPQIHMANVYGVSVPGVEGRAGMVAFECDSAADFDMAAFQALVESELPAYAQPVFIRLLQSAKTTMTFKLLKGELREQAYHPDKVNGDPIYVRQPRSAGYTLLDDAFYEQLMAGTSGY